ncbi:AlpA family transcriptional regulator [Photobacterium damselae]|nr:AlpA family transcriptional regulator [Photobacterium damselae]WIH20962.1 AlpA family transcriptional regulator [Photobacterium damselae]
MRFIRLKEVMHVTGLGRSSIYNYMAEGRFPKTVSLGGRAVAWVESEITDWMLERVSGRHSYLNK